MVSDPNQIDGLKALSHSDESSERANLLQRILLWLRAGYPGGVPREDYVALFGVLHRQLTDAEIQQIAASLGQAHADDAEPISVDEVSEAIRGQAHEHPSPEDIARVNAHLAAGGWPLAQVSQAEAQPPQA